MKALIVNGEVTSQTALHIQFNLSSELTTWNLNECLIEVCLQELLSVVWVLSACGNHHVVGISVVLVYGT